MRTRKISIGRSGLGLVNRIARPLDALAAADSLSCPAPIMVTGLPRSGTTLVYELLVQAFEVGFLTRLYSYAYGLPNFATRLVARKIRQPFARYDSAYGRIPGRYAPAENAVFWDRWLAESEALGHHVPAGRISRQDSLQAEKTVASMSEITQLPYVFKNIYLALSIPAFLRLLPASRLIVVTRDIEEITASVYNRRKSMSGWWSIRPPFAADVKDSSMLEQTAFQCVRARQLLEHSLTTVPSDRVLVRSYELICADPQQFIEDVALFSGAEFVRRRDGQDIPGSFVRSKGPVIPDDERQKLGQFAEPLEASAQRYLARIEERHGTQPADARA